MSRLSFSHSEVRWVQPHDLQEMSIRVLLAVREEVHPPPLSLLQLPRLPRNDVWRPRLGLHRAPSTILPLPAPSSHSLPPLTLLPRSSPRLHDRLLVCKALHLGSRSSIVLRVSYRPLCLLPERVSKRGLDLVSSSTSSSCLLIICGTSKGDSDDVWGDLLNFLVIIRRESLLNLIRWFFMFTEWWWAPW